MAGEDLTEQAHAINAALAAKRLPLGSERDCQDEIERTLAKAGVAFRREVALGKGAIIDFLAGTVGIEVKLKGSKRSIHRQCVHTDESRIKRLAELYLARRDAK